MSSGFVKLPFALWQIWAQSATIYKPRNQSTSRCPPLQNYTAGLPDELQYTHFCIFAHLCPLLHCCTHSAPPTFCRACNGESPQIHFTFFVHLCVFKYLTVLFELVRKLEHRRKASFGLHLYFFYINLYIRMKRMLIYISLHEVLYHFKGTVAWDGFLA